MMTIRDLSSIVVRRKARRIKFLCDEDKTCVIIRDELNLDSKFDTLTTVGHVLKRFYIVEGDTIVPFRLLLLFKCGVSTLGGH